MNLWRNPWKNPIEILEGLPKWIYVEIIERSPERISGDIPKKIRRILERISKRLPEETPQWNLGWINEGTFWRLNEDILGGTSKLMHEKIPGEIYGGISGRILEEFLIKSLEESLEKLWQKSRENPPEGVTVAEFQKKKS